MDADEFFIPVHGFLLRHAQLSLAATEPGMSVLPKELSTFLFFLFFLSKRTNGAIVPHLMLVLCRCWSEAQARSPASQPSQIKTDREGVIYHTFNIAPP